MTACHFGLLPDPTQTGSTNRRQVHGGFQHSNRQSATAPLQPRQQDFVELAWNDRLGDMLVHSRRQASLAIFAGGVGGHGEDGGFGVDRSKSR